MALQSWGGGLWTVDHPLVVGGLQLGTRTTVARLDDGSLAVCAPGPLGDEDAAAITARGRCARRG